MSTSAFTGLIPPICTPLRTDGSVDDESLRDLIEYQIAAGASGIFVLGSSGEAIYLDDEQRHRVATAAHAAIAQRVPLLVGALAPTAQRVAQQIRSLDAVRADAFVVTAPFYAQPSQAEIAAHFRHAAAASSLPILAYNIPGNVGYEIPEAISIELLRSGEVVGFKDSSGNMDAFRAIVEGLGPSRTSVCLSGADSTALQALDVGADGLIPGLANARPQFFVELLAARAEVNTDRAEVFQRAITELTALFRVGQAHGLGRHASEVGGLKFALQRAGVIRDVTLPHPLEAYPPGAQDEAAVLLDNIDRQLALDLERLNEVSKGTMQ